MQRDPAIVLDILSAAKKIVSFKTGINKQEFLKNELVQSGVLHQLIVIGEAVKRLSSDVRDANPQVPWKLIAGMRDRLTHGYFDVDLEEVWSTTEKDIPELVKNIELLAST